jgi:hypothetical protein
MSLPQPEPGLVIRYAYLGRHEHNRGQEEGRKDRPRIILLAVEEPERKATRVTVAAITHSTPHPNAIALELPLKVKHHLGLDDAPSWITLDEVNQFHWPGFDLCPLPGQSEKYAYGFIPPRLHETATQMLLAANQKHRVAVISRD